MTTRKDESCTSLIHWKIIIDESVCKTFVQICTDVVLVDAKPIQLVLPKYYPCINNKLLEQMTILEDGCWFMLPNMKTKLVEDVLV